jgi:hypothetical protein
MPDVYLRSIEPPIAIILTGVCGSALRAIAALLGRFLPRLGPLAATQAAFLFVYAVTSAAFRASKDSNPQPGRRACSCHFGKQKENHVAKTNDQ